MSTCVHIVKLDTVCDYEINIKIKVYRCMSPSVHIAGVFFRERGRRWTLGERGKKNAKETY